MKAKRPETDSAGNPLAYRVADAQTLRELEAAVNKALEDGYEPEGGVSHSLLLDGHEVFAQALRKGKGRRG